MDNGDPARSIVYVRNFYRLAVIQFKATRIARLTAAIRVKQCSIQPDALVRHGNYLTLSRLEVSVGFEQSDGRYRDHVALSSSDGKTQERPGRVYFTMPNL